MTEINLPEMNIVVREGLRNVIASRRVPPASSETNRCSGLDSPCERQLFYRRVAGDRAIETTDGLQGVFETGSEMEDACEPIVIEVDRKSSPRWRIVQKHRKVEDGFLRSHKISGTIDGVLEIEVAPNQWVDFGVIDIKTMSPNVYPLINTYEDLDRFFWTKKYRGQLQLYSFGLNYSHCFLLCINKSNWYDMKIIHFPVDLNYVENLIQKADRINAAVDSQTPPDFIQDASECERCPFLSHCCPDLTTGGNAVISTNAELDEILNRLDELKPTAKEFKELEDRRDDILVKGQDVVCGNHIVKWKAGTINYKAKVAETVQVWRKTIVRVG